MSGSVLAATDISDDVWSEIFYYLSVKDFTCLGQCCKQINHITTSSTNGGHVINHYWKYQCQQLINDEEMTIFKCDNWYKFYLELIDLLVKNQFYTIINGRRRVYKKRDIMNGYYPPSSLLNLRSINNYNSVYCICKSDYLLLLKMLTSNWTNIITNKNFQNKPNENENEIAINTIEYLDINDIHPLNHQMQRSVLTAAIQYKSLQIVNYILKMSLKTDDNCNIWQSIDINFQDKPYKNTCLIYACSYGYYDIVELLLNHPKMSKNGINLCDYAYQTAFVCACKKKHENIILLMLKDERVDINLYYASYRKVVKTSDWYQPKSPFEIVLQDICSQNNQDIGLAMVNCPRFIVSTEEEYYSLKRKIKSYQLNQIGACFEKRFAPFYPRTN